MRNCCCYKLYLLLLMAVMHGSLAYAKSGSDLNDSYWRILANDASKSDYERLNALDSLIDRNPSDRKDLLIKKKDILHRMMRYADESTVYGELYNMEGNNAADGERMEILRDWSRSLMNSGNFTGSVQKNFELLKIKKPDALKIMDAEAYVTLACCDIEFGAVKDSYREILMADSILKKYRKFVDASKAREVELSIIKTKANYYAALKEYHKSIEELQKAYELEPNPLDKLDIESSMATVYQLANMPEASEKLYRKVIGNMAHGHNLGVAVANYAYLLYNRKEYAKAIALLDSMQSNIPASSKNLLASTIMEIRALSLAALGRHENAYEILRKSKSLRDSLNASFVTNSQMSVYELESTLEELDIEQKHAKKMTHILLCVVALACMLLITLLLYIRKLRIKSGEVERLKEISVSDRKEWEKNYNDLQSAIGTRENVSYTLQLAQSHEFTNEILRIVDTKGESAASKLMNISALAKRHNASDSMWNLFTLHFEKTHPYFFRRLNDLHPDLSPNEVRMCAYILMNLTTKEIAMLTNRSVRTVESVKYRIHKKFGLTDESTYSYLHRLLS